MSRPIEAITFDLWDTIVIDDSDELKRRKMGLPSKRDARRLGLWQALDRQQTIDRERVDEAYDAVDGEFNEAWHDQHITWPIAERLRRILDRLGSSLPQEDWNQLVRAHEEMEVEIPPDLIDGCREALEELSASYPLAIVSDAIVSPGRCLRQLLDLHRVDSFFQGHAFSDEVGRSKPHRKMFETVASQLEVPLESMVHVGDREHNDILGPHRLGMGAILFTASRSVDAESSEADAVCSSFEDLPGIIESLASQRKGADDEQS